MGLARMLGVVWRIALVQIFATHRPWLELAVDVDDQVFGFVTDFAGDNHIAGLAGECFTPCPNNAHFISCTASWIRDLAMRMRASMASRGAPDSISLMAKSITSAS